MSHDAPHALELLRLGTQRTDAIFRDGQENAIRHVVEGRGRLLVVQKTGWGKSFVYFIAARLLREEGAGPGLLVDDMVDSRWTLTVAAWLLTGHGSGPIYPLALASTAHTE